MKKNVFVVVSGYIKNEVFAEIESALAEYYPLQGSSLDNGLHIYLYNSEGVVSHLCSNYALPEGTDIGYLLEASSEKDMEAYQSGVEEAGLVLYPTPYPIEAYEETASALYLGGLLGYDEEGGERYEA